MNSFIDAYISYNNQNIEYYTTHEGQIEFYPSINSNTVVINKIIVNNTDKRYEILLTFFNTLIKEYCIYKIVIIKNKLFSYDKMLSYNYNNLFFRDHIDCYILCVNNFLCYKCCRNKKIY
jgi:hypothetical protein